MKGKKEIARLGKMDSCSWSSSSSEDESGGGSRGKSRGKKDYVKVRGCVSRYRRVWAGLLLLLCVCACVFFGCCVIFTFVLY